MAISSVGNSGYTPLPTFQEMATVMAARPSMAEISAKAAVQVSAQSDDLTAATNSAAATSGGRVDMYL
jgi:hypothetical protein